MHPMLLRLRPKYVHEFAEKKDLGEVNKDNFLEIGRKAVMVAWTTQGGFVADMDYFEGFPIFDDGVDGREHPDKGQALNPAHPAFTLSLPIVDGFQKEDTECGVCLSVINSPVMELPAGIAFTVDASFGGLQETAHARCVGRSTATYFLPMGL